MLKEAVVQWVVAAKLTLPLATNLKEAYIRPAACVPLRIMFGSALQGEALPGDDELTVTLTALLERDPAVFLERYVAPERCTTEC